ncbi:tryptophan halogenase family protein [Pseudoalteromonas sp. BDTF-M6]|uniref:tryptophan halogenase family protein n=1 Tax=Pseudoalteromonas sp. BDTF-M6 TaxID=2796132 RepID=UPI001BB0AE1D|nr:tryptophan halogenase family protein [Pseudoalteromonas sp. BDTF-M6]MBS3798559.1 tryptophan 7-halogenase [Pseudoalteromonas sp. BDTF-M6]
MQDTQIRSVLILGGGTAAWLSANHLATQLKGVDQGGVKITLLESPDTPTIGVGEGTVPLMVHTLKEFGICESEFINACDVSFKQGIRFNNWMQPQNEQPHYYYHPFDYPLLNKDNLAAWCLDPTRKFAHQVGTQAQICDQGLAPKTICCPQYQGQMAYGYHLDAAKFAALLAKQGREQLGVNHQSVHIEQVQLDDTGAIKALIDNQGRAHSADLYIDCSGFSSRLLGQAMQVPFVDKSDILFVNKALAIQVPHQDPQAELPSCTLATAQSAGWIWDIALPTRRGVGHVFSDRYISTEQAHKQLADYLGMDEDKVEAREIAMPVGYRQKFWHKNCVAIGLAQGFVEPLEATGLLVFDATAKLLASQFPTNQHDMAALSERFNERVGAMWDSVIQFIKLHYAISNRDDNAFWRDNRNPNTWPPGLAQKLTHWRHHLPSHYDFNQGFDAFRLENYLYVLYGMDFKTDLSHSPMRIDCGQSTQLQEALVAKGKHLCTQLPCNRALLNSIRTHGLNKR